MKQTKPQKKAMSQTIWLVVVVIISLLLVLVLVEFFTNGSEKMRDTSSDLNEQTGNAMICSVKCSTCCTLESATCADNTAKDSVPGMSYDKMIVNGITCPLMKDCAYTCCC
ncbi:MAG: hypothetical protein K0B02_04915 [DPANN group archaeon]|nr:hypothetical protein [DPANN group archaeon]